MPNPKRELVGEFDLATKEQLTKVRKLKNRKNELTGNIIKPFSILIAMLFPNLAGQYLLGKNNFLDGLFLYFKRRDASRLISNVKSVMIEELIAKKNAIQHTHKLAKSLYTAVKTNPIDPKYGSLECIKNQAEYFDTLIASLVNQQDIFNFVKNNYINAYAALLGVLPVPLRDKEFHNHLILPKKIHMKKPTSNYWLEEGTATINFDLLYKKSFTELSSLISKNFEIINNRANELKSHPNMIEKSAADSIEIESNDSTIQAFKIFFTTLAILAQIFFIGRITSSVTRKLTASLDKRDKILTIKHAKKLIESLEKKNETSINLQIQKASDGFFCRICPMGSFQ